MPDRSIQSYKVLVGMEIHVQLATKSKMFTGAANGFGGEPNSQVDEVVLGLPGTLPVMNRKAVEYWAGGLEPVYLQGALRRALRLSTIG